MCCGIISSMGVIGCRSQNRPTVCSFKSDLYSNHVFFVFFSKWKTNYSQLFFVFFQIDEIIIKSIRWIFVDFNGINHRYSKFSVIVGVYSCIPSRTLCAAVRRRQTSDCSDSESLKVCLKDTEFP